MRLALSTECGAVSDCKVRSTGGGRPGRVKKMVWTEGYKEVGNDSQETFNSEKQFKNKTRNSSSAILSV